MRRYLDHPDVDLDVVLPEGILHEGLISEETLHEEPLLHRLVYLHHLDKETYTSSFEMLIKDTRVDFSLSAPYGSTAFQEACECDDLIAVKLLLPLSDPLEKTLESETPFSLSMSSVVEQETEGEVAMFLLRKGVANRGEIVLDKINDWSHLAIAVYMQNELLIRHFVAFHPWAV